jgi:glycosyltransferase involved in cell wall biosynthesis
MLDICLISYEFPPVFGGEGMYTYGLAKALSRLGHNITVITTDIGSEITVEEEDFGIVRISPIKKPFLKMLSFNIRSSKKIKEISKHQNVDICHYTTDYANFSLYPGVSTIATLHHPFAEERRACKRVSNNIEYLRYLFRYKIPFLELLERKTCNKANKRIAVSRYVAESIIKEYHLQSNDVVVIPNAVNTDLFNPGVAHIKAKELFFRDSQKKILFVGRLEYHKGIFYLIKAFSMLKKDIPKAKLVIVGEGKLKNGIKSFIDALNLENSVKILGGVESEYLPSIYAASDLFVLPSIMEGFGIVLLEAMATGKPCVTTMVGGIEDVVIDGKTGIIVPPADTVSLYHAMKTILVNDDLAKKLGMAGRKRVKENFTWDIVAKRTVDVYKEMLQYRSRRGDINE